jgi:L-ascorbate metabolism protein UlaG (beta-lactamase superfamily)
LFGAVFGVPVAAAQDESKPIITRINFIANEGLLLMVGTEMGVLIDALFRDSVPPYDKIPGPALEQMETAQRPFEMVKLVLVTHKHADHFDAQSVARFLAHNTSARFVSSQQVTDELKAAVQNYDALAERITSLRPAGNDVAVMEVEGIKVNALALSHGSGNMEEIVNLGYVLEIAGKRLLHVGDAELNEKSKEPLAQHALGVDTACLPYWWLLDEEGRKFVDKTLKPKSIVALHIPLAEVEDIAHKIRAHMPEVVVFTGPFASKRL